MFKKSNVIVGLAIATILGMVCFFSIKCGGMLDTGLLVQPLGSNGCGLTPPTLFDGGYCSADGGVQITIHQYDDAGVQIDGGDRTAFLEVPCTYNSNNPMPSLWGWHGTQTAALQTPGMSLALTKQVQYFYPTISLYPDALIQPWDGNQRAWDYKVSGKDMYFRDQAFQWLTNTYCIDLNRVGSYGFSSGAIWSDVLACVRPSTTLGIGTIEGEFPTNTPPFNHSDINTDGGCGGPVSFFGKYDDDDQTIPLSGYQYQRDYWITSNNDTLDAGQWNKDGGDTHCVRMLNPDGGQQVVSCEYPAPAGGHTWTFPRDTQNLASFFKTIFQ